MIIQKIINVKLSRPQVVLVFGLLAIGFFALTYFTSPELKSLLRLNNDKTIQKVEGQSQSLVNDNSKKEEPKTTPSQATKPIYSNSKNTNSVISGATAQCNDETYSFSQNKQGTCSYHGGVKNWLE